MVYESQYAGKCKDCGKTYAVGDGIELNGNESVNKKGEMKGHWCPDGKSCQGVQQIQGSPQMHQRATTTGSDLPATKDPTSLYSESLRKVYDAHKTELEYPETIRIYIKVLHDCEIMGIMEPQVIGMMFNNTIRRLQ